MRIFQRRKLSVLLAGLFCFMSVMQPALPVRADGEHDPVEIDGITYEWDDAYVGVVGTEGPEGDISVPEDYHLVMGDELMGNNTLNGITVSLSSGAWLEIYGNVNFQGSISASDGAYLTLNGLDSVPSYLTLYEEDAETSFSGIEDSWSHTFCYIGELGRWAILPGDPWVNIGFGGFDPETDTVTVQFKYTGESEEDYRTFGNDDLGLWEDESFPGNFNGGFGLFDIPDPWDNEIQVKVVLESTRSVIMLAADNDTGDLSDCISNSGTEFNITLTYDECSWFGISLGYADSGDPAIAEKACEFLYAYCPTAQKSVKDLFAEEIVCRLMDPSLYEYFGMPEIDGDAATRAANVDEMAEHRITADGQAYTVTAKDTHGQTVTVQVQNYKVCWGSSMYDGSEVSCILPVYTLNDANEVLICTDFNSGTGRGSNFYICNISNDRINLSNGAGVSDGGVLFLVDSINPATVKAGAMGRIETVINDDGLCTIEVNGGAPASYLRITDPVHNAERIRFLKTSEKYVAVKGEGETKAYGLIGDNGSNTDGIWATGNNESAVARVYVGDSTIHLYPLTGNGTGLSGTGITSVELADSDQADGVTLVTTDLTDVTLSFESNFYDEIPLKITFEGGTVKYLTVIRVGLVIQYRYLDGDPDRAIPGGNHGTLSLDYRNAEISFDYNYYNGEQIAIWATYYHPTIDHTGGANDYVLYLTYDDGSHAVLTADDSNHSFNGRVSASNDAVASTTFLIGFTQARADFDGTVWIGQLDEIEYGGFSATVLNEGFDDTTTYGGTQMGSGKGVYWDGHISFY